MALLAGAACALIGAFGAAPAHADGPVNLLSAMNPSFERSADGWTFSHTAASSGDWAIDGQRSLRVTGTTTNGDVSAWSSFVPVVPGTTYSARVTELAISPLSGMRARLEWWNGSSQISDTTGAPTGPAAGQDGTASVTGVAPAGATRARLRVFDSGTGTWDAYLDGAMIAEGAVPTEFGASTPPNLLSAVNPSFERDKDGWDFSKSASASTAWAYDGQKSMRVTGTASNNDVSAWSSFVPVAAGRFYSGRITEKVLSPLNGMRVRLEWWNGTSMLSEVTGDPTGPAAGQDGTASVTGRAPAGATRARLRVFDAGTGTWDAYLDGAMIVEGGVPSWYYDALPANLLSAANPSFERDTDGWTFSKSAAASTAWAYDRQKSVRVTGTVSNNDVSAFSSFVPVAAGRFYAGRITEKVVSSLGGMRVRLEWWNGSSQIGEATGDAANATAGSEATAGVTGMAPQGATRARLRVFDAGTGTWDAYLDGAMIVEGAVPSWYYDALPVNLLSAGNPGFEWAWTPGEWNSAHTLATSDAWGYESTRSLRLTGTVTNDDVSVFSPYVAAAAGRTYSARITQHVISPLQGLRARLEFWSDTALLGDATGSPNGSVAGEDATSQVSGTAPSGTTRVRLRAFGAGTGTFDAYVDGAMIVEGAVPSGYYATPRISALCGGAGQFDIDPGDSAEMNCVLTKLDEHARAGTTAAFWDGLTPGDAADVAGHLRNAFPTSWAYGGADHVVNTDGEWATAVAAYAALGTQEQSSAWVQGLLPADRDGLGTYLGQHVALGTEDETQLSSVNPSDQDLIDLGMNPPADDTARAAAWQASRCERVRGKRDVVVDVPAAPNLKLGTSTMVVNYCWSEETHRTKFQSMEPLDFSLTWKAVLLGYDTVVRGSNSPGEIRPWDGWSQGERALSWHFDLKFCKPSYAPGPSLPCFVDYRLYHAMYLHYDGSWASRVGLR
jgi:uncharacterized protein YfaP (DUF2135 family)